MSPAGPTAPASGQRRIPWKLAGWAALDFEATGLDFARDTIISFGVVPIDAGRIDVGKATYQLVDPGDVPPSHESVTIHGLRPLDLVEAPSLESAKAALAAALDRRFLVTWWAGVEAAFLDKLYGGGAKSWMRRAVDVRKLVLELEPQLQGLTLTDAAERYGVPVASPHHALDDALVTAQLFLVTATRLASRGRTTFRALQQAGPVPPPVLTRPRAPM